MKILAIETSCDETSAAVVKDGRKILSNIVSSQRDIHSLYGGVVPEIASREHLKLLDPVVKKALKESETTMEDIDALAVTQGPGLVGPLLVGLSYAKGLSYSKDLPLTPEHHIKSHIYANFLEEDKDEKKPEFPLLALVVSGGHSDIIYMKDHGNFEFLGRTIDDAAGEAFDKVSRALGLGYPGGPEIDKLARQGEDGAVEFPRAKLKDKDNGAFDFSFSGLKSAVLNYLNRCRMKNEPVSKEDVCLGFQKAVIDMLVTNTLNAAREKNVREILLAGGVSANSALRDEFKERASNMGIKVRYPSPALCTDNAAMVAAAAYQTYQQYQQDQQGEEFEKNFKKLDLNAVPNLSL